MSVILMATADLPDESGLGWLGGFTFRSTDQARTGSYSYKTIHRNGTITRYFPGKATIYLRVAVYSQYWQYWSIREGTTIHVRLTVDPFAGSITVARGSTTIGTVTGLAITGSSWFVVEAKITIHDTAGEVTLRVNGAEVYSLTNVDTRNAGTTGLLDNILLTGSDTSSGSYWDDILIDDASWPGLGGLHVLAPSGAGTHQDWTGALPTLTTDATIANTKHTFTKDALPANAVNISAAGIATTSRVTGQGYGALKPLLGAAEGAVVAQSVSSQYNLQLFNGPWTPAAFDALEVGVASA